MTPALDYPPVTPELLHDIVRRIRGAGDPLRIVLFGSRARGDARPDSDIDLLIVEESDQPDYRRSPKYYLALCDLFPSKDILVYTPEEVRDWSAVPNAMPTSALREGRVLYVRPD
ncbi:MAG: nucleotidyltransferase domain-containing protein [Planctomycetes bacterium]|nr:nucleotidyltransferase domain-containing protein [Planctomycetota bacterium]